MEEITAIILAGGSSRRMGQDKGLMNLGGRPMIHHVIAMAELFADDIIIISSNKDYEQFGYAVHADEVEDAGPLGGIFTGLNQSKTDQNLILCCDTPMISPELLGKLIDQKTEAQIVIPEHDGFVHHLTGRYHKSILGKAKECIEAKELKLSDFVAKVETEVFNANHLHPINFVNVNSVEEFNALQK